MKLENESSLIAYLKSLYGPRDYAVYDKTTPEKFLETLGVNPASRIARFHSAEMGGDSVNLSKDSDVWLFGTSLYDQKWSASDPGELHCWIRDIANRVLWVRLYHGRNRWDV
jgi:hypothetical protein